VPEANVDLALTVAEDLREQLVDDPCLVVREEELGDGRVRRLLERATGIAGSTVPSSRLRIASCEESMMAERRRALCS
jgi:hypothetical protein